MVGGLFHQLDPQAFTARQLPQGNPQVGATERLQPLQQAAQIRGAAAAFQPQPFVQAPQPSPAGVELEHRLLQLLGLAHHIGHQTQHIKALGLLHRLLQVDRFMLEGPHGQAGFGGLGEPTGREGHILDPFQFRFLAQHPAQVLLLGFRQPRQFAHQGGHHLGGQQVLLGTFADFVWQ